MKVTKIASILLCLTTFACTRTADAPPTQAPQGDVADGVHPAGDPDLVVVDSGMLRDLRITTAPIESRVGGDQLSVLGELAVDEREYAEVGVPIAARVMRLLAGPGDRVRVGQPLIELQSSELGRARSEYLSAEARVKLAEGALERKRGLAAERIVPLREVQEAEAAAAETRAGLRAAAAALTALGVSAPAASDADIQDTAVFVLRSPVRGSVIERNVVRGQMLDPSTPAFRIGDLSVLWLTVHAYERDAVRIKPGSVARITFPALPGQEFSGTVSLIGRQVEKESRTVPVRIDVRNPGEILRPGMSATAAVPVGGSTTPMLTVPVAAVQRVRDEWCVFVPKDGSTFEIRKIGRGRDLGAEVEVLSGLVAGEQIVVDGAFLLKAHAEKSGAGHDEH